MVDVVRIAEMTAQFDKALALVLQTEGGKVDDPRDPGGRTNEGITQAVFTAWLEKQGKPSRDVYLITAAEVSSIYQTQYADPIHFSQLPPGLDYAVFDGAVNSGPVESVKWLQTALGVSADGHVGVLTLAAVKRAQVADTVHKISTERLEFLQGLKTWATYSKGWTTRVLKVETTAVAMSSAPVVAAPASILQQATSTVRPATTPQDVQAKIAADPAAAATALQPVEDHFADQVKAAQDQLDSELKDAQDARQTEVAYVQAKSPLEWVAAAYTAMVMTLFVFVVVALTVSLIWPPARDPGTNTTVYNLLIFFLGALLTEVARCGQFWLGSSHGSKNKDKTLSDLAKTPQVVQGPTSKVNTVESKRR